jgi:hypothetical protein
LQLYYILIKYNFVLLDVINAKDKAMSTQELKRTGKTVAQTTVRIEAGLMERARELAKAERRTVSAFFELMVERELKARGELSA